MDDFEEQLSQALRRKKPPAGFEARVLAAARRRRVSIPAWAGAAAAVVILASAGWGYRQHEGMEAKRQVLLAVRIAAGSVSRIQEQVRGAGQLGVAQ